MLRVTKPDYWSNTHPVFGCYEMLWSNASKEVGIAHRLLYTVVYSIGMLRDGMVFYFLDMVGVGGSNPLAPTN